MEGMAWSFLRSFPLGTALDSIEHSHSSTALQVDLSKRSTAWHVQRRERKATIAGIEILYVHVVEDNVPALKLYEEMGFRTEAREKTNDSKLLGRPSRLLLRLELPS
mmetsp:Transcript_1905/g.11653  ORF Transcript_1905/g.11653 Transcript_1905/m.11653 type:complete len:107 (+) Transcript_1905:3026-3346(+)